MFIPVTCRILTSVLVLFGLFGVVAPSGHAREPLRAASEIGYPPFCVVDARGEADGFAVELLRATLREMGREVTFEVGPWSEVKQSLSDGRVDVLPLVGRTPEREQDFDFTFPYLTLHGTIVVRSDEQEILNLDDLRERTVAVMRGDNAEEFVRRSYPEVELVTTATFADALQQLEQGRYDAVVIQKLLFLQLAEQYRLDGLKAVGGPLEEFRQEFCFAVQEGNDELRRLLDEGLGLVFTKRIYERLYQEWILPLQKQRHGRSRIVVGGDSNYPPYEFLDENGQPAGYNVELTRAVARQLGVDVDFQLRPWYATREALFAGQLDMVHGMFYSPERDGTFDFSSAHTRISHVIVAREGAAEATRLADLRDKRVAVMQGDITHDLLIEQSLPADIVLVDSQEDALRLVAEGDCDYALAARLPALFWAKQNGWENLLVGQQSLVTPEYCFAVMHDNFELVETFDEGLAGLKASGEYREIYQRTLGRYGPGDAKITRYLLYGLIVLGIGLMLALSAVGFLRGKIRAHAEELVKESQSRLKLLEQVEEREATINLILNSTAEGIFGVDIEGTCTFFNHATCSGSRRTGCWRTPGSTGAGLRPPTARSGRCWTRASPAITTRASCGKRTATGSTSPTIFIRCAAMGRSRARW